MKELPILFSGAMVRALLAGEKTQTRRILKGANHVSAGGVPLKFKGSHIEEVCCPYGWIGDRLWVRETFARVDGQSQPWIETDYRATYKHGDRLGDTLGFKKRWTPAIHMPRHASRITLEVTGVRVEHLQNISSDDAYAEGAAAWAAEVVKDGNKFSSAIAAYRALWGQINGPDSWATNPWVWVVDFKVVPCKGR